MLQIGLMKWMVRSMIKKITNEILQNGKLEIMCIFLGIFLYFSPFSMLKYENWNISLSTYFVQERLNGIATFFTITIGVYVAVITVFAMSEIGISKVILEKKLDEALINVIIFGILEDIITVGMAIFIPGNKSTYYILLWGIVVSIISFLKFVVLMVVVFKKNMDQMAKNIDDQENYRNDLLTYLEHIKRNTENHSS